MLLELSQRLLSIGASRRRDLDAADQQRAKDPMEQRDTSNADRADRIAVVGLAQPEKALLGRLTSLLPVLERLLERDLDRCRTGVRVEHARQPARRNLDQLSLIHISEPTRLLSI